MPRQRVSPDVFDDEAASGQGILGMLGSIVSAHPSLAGGSVAFAVIFGFVAANAIWHQPGKHPAPILKTRDVASSGIPVATARPVAQAPATQTPFIKGVPTRTVTTYRIERSDNTPTASIPVPNAAPAPAVTANGPATAAAATPAADPVLARMQTILAEKGLYSGEIDGLMGPKSAAAIRAWEKNNGYAETGEASPSLLAVMDQGSAPAAAAPVEVATSQPVVRPTPKPRPAPAVASDTRAGEPVTIPALIADGPSELVRQIQSGLSNIAYADITVDGVAGSQTRAAISAFEKHYRLPVTGEPNETVLKKLREIGAL